MEGREKRRRKRKNIEEQGLNGRVAEVIEETGEVGKVVKEGRRKDK